MKHCAILPFVVVLVSFCAAQAPTQPVQYFPTNTLFYRNEDEKAYIDVLERFKEPSLLQESKAKANARIYRLLWSGALAVETPIAIRLNINDDGTGSLMLKIASRGKKRQWGKLTVKSREIPKEKLDRFLTLVQGLNLANLPTYDSKPPGLDGSDWLVECVENGSYKMFLRWSPRKGPVREMGFLLSDLAGTDLIREYDR